MQTLPPSLPGLQDLPPFHGHVEPFLLELGVLRHAREVICANRLTDTLAADVRTRHAEAMTIYLFRTADEYTQFMGTMDLPAKNTAGIFFVNAHGRGLATWARGRGVEETRRVLQHEGFHQFADALFPALPVWANEGFAELFENGVEGDGRIVVGEVPPDALRRLQQARSADGRVHFDRFFEVDSAEWGSHVRSGQASLNYLQVWDLTGDRDEMLLN